MEQRRSGCGVFPSPGAAKSHTPRTPQQATPWCAVSAAHWPPRRHVTACRRVRGPAVETLVIVLPCQAEPPLHTLVLHRAVIHVI